ncbi:MAG: DUF1311 domain-containing protein [Proteobacteria bacterium]|nr:DUF1311 domain-containing protein [Pseudomonadota bacterium]
MAPLALLLAALPAYAFEPIQSLADPPRPHPEIEARYTPEYRTCLADPQLNTMRQDRCNAAELARQDRALNRVWQQTIARLAPARLAELRRAERGWITARQRQCDLAAKEGEGGTIATLLYGQCMIDETIRRTLWLERLPR